MQKYIAKRWFFLLMLIGLAAASRYPQELDRLLAPISIKWIAAAALFAMSLGLQARDFRKVVEHPLGLVWALCLSFLVAPAICAAFAFSLLSGDYQLGLLVTGCLPCTLTSAALWTRLAGGNEVLSLVVTITSNILVVVLTPLALIVLTGRTVAFDLVAVMSGLLVFAVIPIVVGQIIRWSPAGANMADRAGPVLRMACRFLVLLMILIAAVDARLSLEEEGRIWTFNGELITVGLACVGAHTLTLILGYLSARWPLGPDNAIAVAISGSQKTLPVGAFLLTEYFPEFPLAIVPLLFYQVGQLLVDTYAAEVFFYHKPQTSADEDEEDDRPEMPDLTDFS